MNLIKDIERRAKLTDATIVLPEANIDKRVYSAAKKILKKKLAKIIVLGKKEEFDSTFMSENCQIIDIENYEKRDELAKELYNIRKEKGLTLPKAKKLILDPSYFGVMLVKSGLADGLVAGAVWSTADTLRPALQIIKTKPDKGIVTGAMIMCKANFAPKVFADVSLIENPTAEQLSDIAISSADFAKNVLGLEPRVAMLSYSTKGSADSAMVDKVRTAVSIANKKSDYIIDGEMQVDSALDETVAHHKGVTSAVGGHANVLIFPDLNAGNIGYKLASRLGGCNSIGPIMLNFNKPVNDLSRGCTVDEIVNTVCITKLLK